MKILRSTIYVWNSPEMPTNQLSVLYRRRVSSNPERLQRRTPGQLEKIKYISKHKTEETQNEERKFKAG
jgi:hypothetical protein